LHERVACCTQFVDSAEDFVPPRVVWFERCVASPVRLLRHRLAWPYVRYALEGAAFGRLDLGSFCGLKISIACQKRTTRAASPDMIITALVTAPDHPATQRSLWLACVSKLRLVIKVCPTVM
jgi:hypothetical protein